jgi:hypothetical protein
LVSLEEVAAAVEEEEEGVVAVVLVVDPTFPTPLRTSPLPHGVGCKHRTADFENDSLASSLGESGRMRTTTLFFVVIVVEVFGFFRRRRERG